MDRLTALRREANLYESLLHEIRSEIDNLEMQLARQRFNCSCVRLNSDIEVWDMSEQERRGRTGLQLGLVGETLSAIKSCQKCGGTGTVK